MRSTGTSGAPGGESGRSWPGSARPRSARRGGTSPSPASRSSCRPAAGYLLMREQPALALDLLPRSDDRACRRRGRADGGGAAVRDVDAEDRPLMASTIITNNVRVAIACFAGGIFLGVGSLVLLGFNGLAIGASRRPLRQPGPARVPARVHPRPRPAGAVRHLGGGRGGLHARPVRRRAGRPEPGGRPGPERPDRDPDGGRRRRPPGRGRADRGIRVGRCRRRDVPGRGEPGEPRVSGGVSIEWERPGRLAGAG